MKVYNLREYFMDLEKFESEHKIIRESTFSDVEKEYLINNTKFLSSDTCLLARFYCLLWKKVEGDFVCPTCGTEMLSPKWNGKKYGFPTYCSRHCMTIGTREAATEAFKRTYKENKIYDKVKGTLEDRYGSLGDFYSQRREKTSSIRREKYNGDYMSPIQKESFSHVDWDAARSKGTATKLSRYGHTGPVNVDWGQVRTSRLIRYANMVPQELLFDKEKIQSAYANGLDSVSEYLGCSRSVARSVLKYHNIRHTQSGKSEIERDIAYWLGSLGIEVKLNDRKVLGGKEIDILIPKHNIGIEYDSLYYHSSDIDSNEAKNYHLWKTNESARNGVALLHIFEPEWSDKNDIWKSMIMNRLGLTKRKVPARKCAIEPVGRDEKKLFLDTNHLNGDVPSSHNFGLYYDGELVMIMTFGKSRFMKGHTELLRMATSLNTIVVGGASKIFNYAKTIINTDIISYCDLRYSTGSIYQSIGMEYVSTSKPSYIYYHPSFGTKSRYECQKHKLRGFLENYDDSLTEKENMFANGWRIMYDCGTNKYIYKINNLMHKTV